MRRRIGAVRRVLIAKKVQRFDRDSPPAAFAAADARRSPFPTASLPARVVATVSTFSDVHGASGVQS